MTKKNNPANQHEILDKNTELTCGKEGSYIIQKQIGKGGFGIVYSAYNKANINAIFAVKTEPKGNGPLFVEISILRKIAKANDCNSVFIILVLSYKNKNKLDHLGLPEFIAMGFHGNTRFLIIPFYKASVEVGIIENKITPANMLKMFEQMIDALQYIHSMKYVHSDIKNFGIASLYFMKDDHVIEKSDKKLMNNGTLEYSSLDSHSGLPLSRRSDLQELIINFFSWVCRSKIEKRCKNFHDSLPWGHIIENSKKDKEIYEKVKKSKISFFTQPENWCSALDLTKDQGLIEIAKYSYSLGYNEDPDYGKLKLLVRKIDFGKKRNEKPIKDTTKTLRSSLRNKLKNSSESESSSSERKKPQSKRGKVAKIEENGIVDDQSSDVLSRKMEEFSKRENGKPVFLNYHIESVLNKATRSSPRKSKDSSITVSTQTSPDLLEKYKTQLKKNKK